MIRLHRLSARPEAFYLNPDLIVAIESTPDTVLTLTTHQKLPVADRAEDVVEAVRAWRASIVKAALPRNPRRTSDTALTLVGGATGITPPPETEESDR